MATIDMTWIMSWGKSTRICLILPVFLIYLHYILLFHLELEYGIFSLTLFQTWVSISLRSVNGVVQATVAIPIYVRELTNTCTTPSLAIIFWCFNFSFTFLQTLGPTKIDKHILPTNINEWCINCRDYWIKGHFKSYSQTHVVSVKTWLIIIRINVILFLLLPFIFHNYIVYKR